MKLTNNHILAIILIAASVLRFYHFGDIPFMHDEFSALFRLDFENFSGLIEKGVKVDGHPAGVQVFLYYWTKLFGRAEWVIKLPFALCGIASVYLVYVVAKKWSGITAGLICAAFVGTIQYTVMYSQIARPYISGLFFSLWMVNAWSDLVQRPDRHFFRNSCFFILAAAACSYNHYFSLLFAMITGISGLFMINRKYLLKYILCGVIVFLLFLPHLHIFIYQIHIGGVGSWLAKPENDYLWAYIAYTFQFSNLAGMLVLALVIFGLYKKNRGNPDHRYYILFGCWFLLPFLIGFFYSRYVNAVLQYSVLIFSFPYLLFLLFGHIKPQKPAVNLMVILTIMIINITTLVIGRQHYKVFYRSHYKELLTGHQRAKRNDPNVLSIIHSGKNVSAYYIAKLDIDTGFVWYNGFGSDLAFKNFLDNRNRSHEQLYLGCISSNNPNTVPIILEYYPVMLQQNNYAGGTSYLFSKQGKKMNNTYASLTFDPDSKGRPGAWTGIELPRHIYTGETAGGIYRMDSAAEYSPVFSGRLDHMIYNENNFIDISVKVKDLDDPEGVELVASLESKGKSVWWGAVPCRDFFIPGIQSRDWTMIHNSVKLSDIYLKYPDITLKVFIRNQVRKSFLIDDFNISIRAGNPVIYGLGERIDRNFK